MIKIENASKIIKKQEILKNINLEINCGDVVMIHGHNGSGKTMLLRLLCGLIKPSSGTVITEQDVRFGVIIENPTFFQNESGFYNLKYLATINKLIDDNEIDKWMKTFNLYEVKKKRVKSYSLGMKQRLALSQAFMENPDVLLLDEPFNGIDDENLEITYEIFAHAKEKGQIIVIASHVKIPVPDLITKEIRMSNGEIKSVTEF